MASESQAGYGSKLLNSEALVTKAKTMLKYKPIPDDIKLLNYEPFVVSVRTAMSPYNTAHKAFKDCQNETDAVQDSILEIARKIRAAVFEIHGPGEIYDDYNHTIDIITGDNVRKNSAKRKAEDETAPPADPNAPEKDFQSVSQQDRGSIYTFFTTLIDELALDTKYLPSEPELQIAGLQLLRDSFGTKLSEYSKLEGGFKKQEGIIKPLFVGPSSLHDRAERAKAHVKRQYGVDSPEYKSLTGKSY
jgi:hypothetical protein